MMTKVIKFRDIIEMNKYSVLLLYPDYLTRDYPFETYYAFVKADNPVKAITEAQLEAVEANGGKKYIPNNNDFAVLLITSGWNSGFATEKIEPLRAIDIVKGIARGCKEAGC